MSTLSSNISTIKGATDTLRTKLSMPSDTLSDVVDAVVVPTGNIEITENGTDIDVSGYATATVDVEGSGPVQNDHIFRVETLAERDALTDMEEGDLCVVAVAGARNFNGTNASSNLVFPAQIKVSTALTDTYTAQVKVNSSIISVYLNIEISNTRVYMYTRSLGTATQAEYTSTDGLTFTRVSSKDSYTCALCDGFASLSSVFYPYLFFETEEFTGIYLYKNSAWTYANVNVPSSVLAKVASDGTVYTNGGFANGTLLTSATWKDSMKRVENFGPVLASADLGTSLDSFYQGCTGTRIITLPYLNTSNVTDMTRMFYNCPNLTTLDLSTLNTSNVTNMAQMFLFCSSLTSINFSGFKTNNVTNMTSMFNGCSSLTSLSLTGFNTSKVTIMAEMFSDCTNLTSVNVSSFNTSLVTNFSFMFSNCSKLTSLNLSSFNMAKATNITSMFKGCSKLKTLNVSYFNPSLATSMDSVFRGCSSLQEINMSSWTSSSVTSMSYMFDGCTSLTQIDMRKLTFSNQAMTITNMFNGVPSNCLIVVKSNTEKSWFQANFPSLTNVKTVAEL